MFKAQAPMRVERHPHSINQLDFSFPLLTVIFPNQDCLDFHHLISFYSHHSMALSTMNLLLSPVEFHIFWGKIAVSFPFLVLSFSLVTMTDSSLVHFNHVLPKPYKCTLSINIKINTKNEQSSKTHQNTGLVPQNHPC